ncbi:unnamed protein product [Nezara viridula]|uniref:Uncharacterized protein n=1 Tax=Nezara viridula TaxID=85310 RepID=A0A9P0E6I5_NEZVI|nr:unnamed protein product [Nezara viridula]
MLEDIGGTEGEACGARSPCGSGLNCHYSGALETVGDWCISKTDRIKANYFQKKKVWIDAKCRYTNGLHRKILFSDEKIVSPMEALEVIGRVESPFIIVIALISDGCRIPLQLTRPGPLSSRSKRTFQSSSLPQIGPEEVLISTYYIIGFGPNWIGWHATEHILTWKASNTLWFEQFSAFLKKCCY